MSEPRPAVGPEPPQASSPGSQHPAASVAVSSRAAPSSSTDQLIANLRAENEALRHYASRCDEELRAYQADFPELAHHVSQRFRSLPPDAVPQSPAALHAAALSPLVAALEHRLQDAAAVNERLDGDLTALRSELLRAADLHAEMEQALLQQAALPMRGLGTGEGTGASVGADGLSSEECMILLQRVDALEESLALREKAERAAAARLAELQPKHAAAAAQNADLQATAATLRRELGAAAALNAQHEARLSAVSKDARRLQQELTHAEQRAAQLEQARVALDATQARAGALEAAAQHEADRALVAEARAAALEGDLAAQTERVAALGRQAEGLVARLNYAREGEVEAARQVSASVQKAAEAESARAVAEQELAAVRAQLSKLRQDGEAELARLLFTAEQDLKEQAAKFTKILAETNKSVETLQERLARAQSERAQSESQALQASEALTRLSRAREADLSEFTRSLQGAQARAAAAAALEAESSAHSERSARETTQLRARLERERQLWEDERSKLVAALAEADAERADAEAAAQHAKTSEARASEALREHSAAFTARQQALAGQLSVVTAAHEKHVMGARAREQTSESELAALAAQAADLSQKQDALLAQSAAALEGTVARAKEHLKSEMAARARAEARLAAAAADAGALRAREAELLSVLAAAEADARDARAAAAALESAEAMHAARVRAVEEAHRALVHAHAELSVRCDGLEARRRQAEHQRDTAIRVARAVGGGSLDVVEAASAMAV